MNDYKIMIVDDEPDILNLLEKALNIEGYYNIITVDNGTSAINTCRNSQPDIIILDVMLPDIDGYAVCKQIRVFSHCPILFLSSKNDELDKILGLSVGVKKEQPFLNEIAALGGSIIYFASGSVIGTISWLIGFKFKSCSCRTVWKFRMC